MFADSPVRAVILLLFVVVVVVQLFRRARGRTRGSSARRGTGGVGIGAMGAVYGMLNEDKRRAIEIVAEQKASAVDPERARAKGPGARTRIAALPDLHEIVRVTNAAYRVEDFFIDGDRTNATEVAEKMTGADACFLVIDARPGELAASVFVEVRGDRGYFGMLSVDPAHQKTGLSRVLIECVEAHCRSAGCTALDIDVVNLREELPAFYQRLGFVETGTMPFDNPRATRAAHRITMSRPIRSHANVSQ